MLCVEDKSENEDVSNRISSDTWIGLAMGADGSMAWDGDTCDSTFAIFDLGEPSIDRNAAVYLSSASTYGAWRSTSPDEANHACACETPPPVKTDPPTPSPTVSTSGVKS